jgi:hypothetical protein
LIDLLLRGASTAEDTYAADAVAPRAHSRGGRCPSNAVDIVVVVDVDVDVGAATLAAAAMAPGRHRLSEERGAIVALTDGEREAMAWRDLKSRGVASEGEASD